MNFSQKLGIFCLILITLGYVYFSFFANEGFRFPEVKPFAQETQKTEDPNMKQETENTDQNIKSEVKSVKIFITDQKGNLRSVNRKCDLSKEKSCFEFAVKSLIIGPTDWEKNKGLSSEIPQNTKILSIRESANNILIDLSPEFESGGGAESLYTRVSQLIKTSQANTKLPVYMYINGRQADVIGGEGIMIKQPLSEKSFND